MLFTFKGEISCEEDNIEDPGFKQDSPWRSGKEDQAHELNLPYRAQTKLLCSCSGEQQDSLTLAHQKILLKIIYLIVCNLCYEKNHLKLPDWFGLIQCL